MSPRDELHQRADSMGDRHLREAGLDRHLGDAPLVLLEAIAVHEDDGDAAETLGVYGPRSASTLGSSSGITTSPRAPMRSVTSTTFVQQLGQANFAVEDARAVLIGDSQRVAEAFVMKSAVGSPLRSSKALVATVVPIFTASMRSTGMGAPSSTPSSRRMPATAASRYCSGFSDRSL